MKTTRTKEEIVNWLKTAQKRQQDWQKEVKQRWAERHQQSMAQKV